MKKLLVALVALFAVTAASAQVNNLGLRFGSGVSIVGQYDLSQSNHIEGRLAFGNHWVGLTGLYNWEIADFNWTPGLGKWFFDAGVGANVGIAGGNLGLAAVGTAQLGIKFNDAPVSITLDLEPTLNLTGGLGFGVGSGVSVVYHF
mgnify:CR=1 FL=1